MTGAESTRHMQAQVRYFVIFRILVQKREEVLFMHFKLQEA
jgi:hypothetical protein